MNGKKPSIGIFGRNADKSDTSDIVIAIAVGAGILSEMAFAWQMKKPIIASTQFEGWGKFRAC